MVTITDIECTIIDNNRLGFMDDFLYRSVGGNIAQAISEGALKAGDRLPSVRSLCRNRLRSTRSGTNTAAGPRSVREHSLLEVDDPVRALRGLRIVRHHEDRLPAVVD